MKSLVYTRVSSEKQIEGTSLSTQKAWAFEECRLRRIQKDDMFFYEEPGLSAENIFSRPKIIGLLNDLESGIFDNSYLFVWDLSRLSRNTEDLAGTIGKSLRQHNITLITQSEGQINLNNLNDRLIYEIKSAVNTFEKGVINRRCQKGIDINIANGFHHGGLPKGYKFDRSNYIKTPGGRKRLKIVPGDSAEFIEYIFKLALNHPPMRIAEILYQRGYPRIMVWDITQLLRYPLYAGLMRNKKGEFIKCVQVDDPIIDEATFYKVNSALKRGATGHTTRKKYILSPYLYCGYCGMRMSYKRNFSKNFMPARTWEGYRCTSYGQSRNRCRESKSHRRQLLESLVLKEIKTRVNNPDRAKKEAEGMISRSYDTDYGEAEKRIKGLRGKKTNLLRAIEICRDDIAIRDVAGRISRLDASIKSIEAKIQSSQYGAKEIEAFIRYLENFGIDDESELPAFYSAAIKRIDVFRDKMKITFNYMETAIIKIPLVQRVRSRVKR